jgi:hypothetical protein
MTDQAFADGPAVRGCTVLTISQRGNVFFSGNDDFDSRDKAYWVDPGDETSYGAIYFGAPDNIQQGFNEKGLAYDANGLPSSRVTAHDGVLPGPKGYALYPIAILKECATVTEVIEWVAEHRWHSAMLDQLHFADASGDAVVISAGDDGRVAYTRKADGDSYLVSTNFNVANPQNGNHPSWRYDLAASRASQLIRAGDVTSDTVASIMEAVHVESKRNFTVYTVVADLVSGTVAVYFLFQYDAPIVLSIEAELAKGPVQTSLRAMFPESTILRGDLALERLFVAARVRATIGIIWAVTVLVCLVLSVLLPVVRRAGWMSLLIVAVLGPIGFLIVLVRGRHGWTAALFNAGFDASSIVATLGAGVLLMVTVQALES